VKNKVMHDVPVAFHVDSVTMVSQGMVKESFVKEIKFLLRNSC